MKSQEVKTIKNSSEKMIGATLEKIIKDGYHIDQIVPLSKTTFLVIVSKEASNE